MGISMGPNICILCILHEIIILSNIFNVLARGLLGDPGDHYSTANNNLQNTPALTALTLAQKVVSMIYVLYVWIRC